MRITFTFEDGSIFLASLIKQFFGGSLFCLFLGAQNCDALYFRKDADHLIVPSLFHAIHPYRFVSPNSEAIFALSLLSVA